MSHPSDEQFYYICQIHTFQCKKCIWSQNWLITSKASCKRSLAISWWSNQLFVAIQRGRWFFFLRSFHELNKLNKSSWKERGMDQSCSVPARNELRMHTRKGLCWFAPLRWGPRHPWGRMWWRGDPRWLALEWFSDIKFARKVDNNICCLAVYFPRKFFIWKLLQCKSSGLTSPSQATPGLSRSSSEEHDCLLFAQIIRLKL